MINVSQTTTKKLQSKINNTRGRGPCVNIRDHRIIMWDKQTNKQILLKTQVYIHTQGP